MIKFLAHFLVDHLPHSVVSSLKLLLRLFAISTYYCYNLNFSHLRSLVVFHWSLIDSRFPQISWTPQGILNDLNNIEVLMVSILPLISNSFILSSKPLRTVPSAPITTGITVTLIFHISGKDQHVFLLIYTKSGLLVGISWSICSSKSQGILCVTFSRMDCGLCVFHLSAGSNFNLLNTS